MGEMNEVLEKLPKHLLKLIIDQPYNSYTAQDHALWRFVMRQNVKYLQQVAHGSYLEGLKLTGISIEHIPEMYGMNRILKKIGWAAAAVDGFIPPSAFMEFQAYNVLVIAADIRPIDQIEYTPAPDIIHEAAGHAPIIADAEYAKYLRDFGYIGSRAFSSAADYRLYEAIRHLSIIKTDPYTPKEDIVKAEQKLKLLEKELGEPSEMALIRNLHWWTVEYGLIGSLSQPKIYGAGLLSSIGESKSCLQDHVKKIPYSLAAKDVGFDITTQQPQLFVTPDFEYLNTVLSEFAETMALRRGGLYGIEQAIRSKNTATCTWSSGLQVSGTFSEVITKNNEPIYLKTNSPTTLNCQDKIIEGHTKSYHNHGYSSPIGRIKGFDYSLEKYAESDLEKKGVQVGNVVEFDFESGIKVTGKINKLTQVNGKLVLISFSDCHVSYQNNDLFLPDWGIFDMAIGDEITSAFSGPADPNGFELSYNAPLEKTHKIQHSEKAKALHALYADVRRIRESNKLNGIPQIWDALKKNHSDDWLLALEIYELVHKNSQYRELSTELKDFLERKGQEKRYANLISEGFDLIAS